MKGILQFSLLVNNFLAVSDTTLKFQVSRTMFNTLHRLVHIRHLK